VFTTAQVFTTADIESQHQRGPKPNDAGARSKPAPGLHLVATPIGNAADITLRALDTLAGADVIACEDTRVTRKLATRYGIKTRLLSYHEHNAERVRPLLLARLERGEAVALVADAGTPLISDPGYKLVRACIAAGHGVTVVPGPSAPLAALVVSGLPTDRFVFAGFLPGRPAARRKALADLAAIDATLVFFESARRLPAALADMAAVLGEREAAVARELTKLFEEVRRAPLGELAARYRDEGPPKGEVVVVVGPPPPGAAREPVAQEALDAQIRRALETSSVRDAAAEVAAVTGLPRRRVYARAVELAQARRGRKPRASGPGGR
jgi:16S rRNA (cytidine1402-2'-O)-methyltransferase